MGSTPREAVDLGPGQRAAWLSVFDRLPRTRPATWCVLCGQVAGVAGAAGPMPGPRRGVVELVATTDTLMGIADLPAENSGMGPVTAEIARQVAGQMRQAWWRYSVYDPMNRLMHHGVLHQRPATGGHGTVVHRTSRLATGRQAAWVLARDRTCVAPGCRRQCDVDHSVEWVKGGDTVYCNLSLLCRAHHLFRHATGSQLIQPVPGVFWWQTPAGLQYHTTSDPPLLIDTNQLAGIPKPPSPDATTLPAHHTITQWNLPSWLGANPNLLAADDVLTASTPG